MKYREESIVVANKMEGRRKGEKQNEGGEKKKENEILKKRFEKSCIIKFNDVFKGHIQNCCITLITLSNIL